MSPAIDIRETVILVHGTFAAPDRVDATNRRTQWYEEEHAFVGALNQELAALGSAATCWKHRRGVAAPPQAFAWSGENSWLGRREAAEALRLHLLALGQEGWVTHVIAHSHGGNVVLEALDFFGTGIPVWFKGKIVLFGTPALEPKVKLHDVGLLYVAARFVGIALLWLAVIAIALFWDRSWWHQGRFFTLDNLVILATFLIVIIVFFIGHFAYEFLKRTAFNRQANEGADPVREHVLMIGSQWDEAFQLLHKAKLEPNPLLRKDTATLGPAIVDKSRRGPLAIAHQAARKAIREIDLNYFQIERRDAYWFALTANLVIASGAVAALAGWIGPTDRWIAIDVVIIAALVSFAINRSYLGAWAAANGLPLRVCFWVGGYCWRMLRAIVMHLGDRRLRIMAWSTLTNFAYGLSGSPFRLQDVEVHKSLPKAWETSFTYLELPHEIVARAMQARADAFRSTSVGAVEQSIGGDPNVGLVHSGLLEIAQQPLIHTCYYGEPLCVHKAAQWIAAPLRKHEVDIPFRMDTMEPLPFSYRGKDNPDARFDDPEKAWTL